jgi:general secretion pathway protein A
LITRYSKGIPRIINVLCDRALLGAYVEGKRQVTKRIVKRAASEVLPLETGNERNASWWLLAGALSTALAVVAIALLQWPRVDAWLADAGPQPGPVSAPVRESLPVPAAEAKPGPEPESEPSPVIAPQPEVAEAENLIVRGPALAELLTAAGPSAAGRAWSGLFRLWGYESSADNDEQACKEAARVKLRCMRKAGSWTVLMQYDRPALLLLSAPDGRWVTVLMAEVRGDSVGLEIDGAPVEFPRSEVEMLWQGKYRILWRTTPGNRAALYKGQSNADVRWLKGRLGAVMGVEMDSGSPFYSAALFDLVKQFQTGQGLLADGVVGPATLIALNSTIKREGVPRLIRSVSDAQVPEGDS